MKAIGAGAPAPEVTDLDLTRAQIAALFPGWHIWYVRASGTWNARPWPLVSAGSAGQLMDDMVQAHAESGGKWPALTADYDLTSAPADFPYDLSDVKGTQS